MKLVTPTLEVISSSFGSSFSFYHYDENANIKSNVWHYHPEIELVFVNGGSGKRQIDSHISYYTNGDLILIGSHLPHCGFTNEQTGNKNETVIQMEPDFLGNGFLAIPEMKNIQNLFHKSKSGIAFGEETKNAIRNSITIMLKQNPFERLINLLNILEQLSQTDDYKILNAAGFSLELQTQDNNRINKVFNYVKDHFQEPILLNDVSNMVGMTTPSFCRYFKKITNKTFTAFVNEYRIVHATKQLTEQTMSITEICFESGFNNFSHFNKLFKIYTGKSASQYRQNSKKLL